MSTTTRFLLVLSFAALVGCDRKAPPMPVPPAPATSTAKQATPNLDELAAIYHTIPEDRFMLTAYQKPQAVGLELLDPPEPNSRDQLVAWLESVQPLIQRIVDLSGKPLEPFPPEVWDDDNVSASFGTTPRIHVQRAVSILKADAARCFGKGDTNDGLVRLAATVRFGASLIARRTGIHALTGSRLVAGASMQVIAVAEGKPEEWSRADVTAAKGIRGAFATIDTRDPAGQLARWEADARESVAEFRKDYAVAGGAAKYAASLRIYGIDAEAATLMSKANPLGSQDSTFADMLRYTPTKQFADRAESLTVDEITSALDSIEAQIPVVAKALRSEDEAALAVALRLVPDEPTQLARFVLGSASSTLPLIKLSRERIESALQAIERLPK